MSSELQANLRGYLHTKFDFYELVEVPKFELISSNSESSVYAFDMRYKDKGTVHTDKLILKVFTDDMYGKDRTLKERHALKQLFHRGYPVPRPIASEIEPVHLGMPFIIMERVPGQLLGDALAVVSGDEQRELIERFVGPLADLHTMKWQVLADNLIVKDEYTLIKRELYNLKTMAAEYESLQPVLQWLNDRREDVPCLRPSITHGDYHPWNVLLTDDDKLSVIDWGWHISDPRYDVGWTLTTLARDGLMTLRESVLEAYEKLTEHAVDQLTYFEVLTNLRWLLNILGALKSQAPYLNGTAASARDALTIPVKRTLEMLTKDTGLELPTADQLLSIVKS